MISFKQFIEQKNPRIPRKKGQPANSKKHSDLYTDENPKGTIHGLKFATVDDAKLLVLLGRPIQQIRICGDHL